MQLEYLRNMYNEDYELPENDDEAISELPMLREYVKVDRQYKDHIRSAAGDLNKLWTEFADRKGIAVGDDPFGEAVMAPANKHLENLRQANPNTTVGELQDARTVFIKNHLRLS